MTGLLKSVLHEHADTTSIDVDLDSVIAAGDRRVRGRRLGAAALGSAAVLAVTGVTVAGVQLLNDDATPVVSGENGFKARKLSYASDGKIHYGDTVIDAGAKVMSYVQTDQGFVWTVANGDVIFGDGSARTKIGRTSTDGYYLKSDDSGSLVAWVEFPTSRAPEFVVYDTADQHQVLRTNEGNTLGMTAYRDTDAAYIYAVDDGSVYWRDATGAVKYDVAAGRSTFLGDAQPFTISDVANGLLAYQPPIAGQDADESQFHVGPSLDEGVEISHRGNAVLSPDGTYIAFEDADEMFVNRTDDATDVTPRVDGYDYHVVYQWYDDDTAGVFGIKTGADSDTLDLQFMTCEIPAGTCTNDGGEVSIDVVDFAFPNGEYIGG